MCLVAVFRANKALPAHIGWFDNLSTFYFIVICYSCVYVCVHVNSADVLSIGIFVDTPSSSMLRPP